MSDPQSLHIFLSFDPKDNATAQDLQRQLIKCTGMRIPGTLYMLRIN